MIGRGTEWVVVFVIVLAASAVRGDNAPQRPDRVFEQCYLYRDTEGVVWVRSHVVSFGTVGWGEAPNIRLTRETAEQLAPLVSVYAVDPRDRESGQDHEYRDFRFDPSREGSGPVFLLTMACQTRVASPSTRPTTTRRTPRVFDQSPDREVITAEIVEAEIMSRECAQAWRVVTESIRTIVALSRTAPGPDKKRGITEAIEKGAQALATMSRIKGDDDFVALVTKIQPKAVFKTDYQESLREQQQDTFEAFVQVLQIRPKTELPALKKRWVSKRIGKHSTGQPSQDRDPRRKWGVSLRWANADTLAEKLLLRGLGVEEVVDGGPDLGFRKGDVIIDYMWSNDLTRGGLGPGDGSPPLPSCYDGKVDILRGNQAITLTVPR
jgi:hypothetical protein